MIAFALSLMLLAAQAPAVPAAAAAVPAPAAPAAQAPASVSPRLEAILAGLKGQPRTAVTDKLGPPESVKQGADGQVLFWSHALPGEMVCGADASGALACRRQGAGICALAMAFKDVGGLSLWRIDGDPAACEAAAALFKPAG